MKPSMFSIKALGLLPCDLRCNACLSAYGKAEHWKAVLEILGSTAQKSLRNSVTQKQLRGSETKQINPRKTLPISLGNRIYFSRFLSSVSGSFCDAAQPQHVWGHQLWHCHHMQRLETKSASPEAAKGWASDANIQYKPEAFDSGNGLQHVRRCYNSLSSLWIRCFTLFFSAYFLVAFSWTPHLRSSWRSVPFRTTQPWPGKRWPLWTPGNPPKGSWPRWAMKVARQR